MREPDVSMAEPLGAASRLGCPSGNICSVLFTANQLAGVFMQRLRVVSAGRRFKILFMYDEEMPSRSVIHSVILRLVDLNFPKQVLIHRVRNKPALDLDAPARVTWSRSRLPVASFVWLPLVQPAAGITPFVAEMPRKGSDATLHSHPLCSEAASGWIFQPLLLQSV